VDIAIFIFGTNPLVPSRPVVITIAISIISPTLVFPFTVAAISITVAAFAAISITVAAFAAISIAVAFAAFAARSLPFVGLLHLLL
jgi:hypothetical protein